jgi:hypothetical protein
MASTIFQAPEYDPRRERRRKQLVAVAVLVVLLLAALAYLYRNWPEERVVDRFFTTLERQDFERAYAIWFNDPGWKQHPERYAKYPFREFYIDWGPGGEWGVIKSHEIEGSASPKGGASGVVVLVRINDRAEPARIWVEKSDKTLTFSPY